MTHTHRLLRAGRIAVFGVALLLMGAVAAGCQVEDEARRLNREGNAAYDEGNYQSALDLYRRAQVEAPDEAAYIYNGGNALHRLGQYDRAIPESQRAATDGPDDVRFRAYYALGNHYVRSERLREARDAYKNALKILPSDLDAKFNLEVVQRRLDEQQQQQEQQEQQQGDGQQDQQQPGQQQGQQPGQQQGQQPGQQDQQQQGQQPGQQQGQQPGQQPSQQQPGQQQPGGQPGQQQGQPTQQELDRALREAAGEFERSPTVEEALRILELIEEQQRLRRSQAPTQTPGGVRDQ